MSSGPENRFIQGVHRLLPRSGIYHMKNHNMYIGGILDCWYSGVSDLWVEYKFLEIPKRDTTTLDFFDSTKKYALSDLQQRWFNDRHEEGRSVAVIVGTAAGGVWFDYGDPFTCTTKAFRARLTSKRDLADLITRRVSRKP